jgi:hypothetical protein
VQRVIDVSVMGQLANARLCMKQGREQFPTWPYLEPAEELV